MQGSRERREGLRKRGMQGSRKGGRDAGRYVFRKGWIQEKRDA